jgi:ABC-type transport system substrate-binding protein
MIGSKLADRYEITAELGRGGMGVVYRARDPLLSRDVAVKLIPPNLLSPEMEQRFQREAQLVAQMDHPSIVSVYDIGRHEGSLFFVMALVQGTNLRAFLRERSLLGEIVDVGVQVADALEYSHARGVVHRDIKPENVMVSEEGGGVRVRVMDFGLARSATETRLTKSGALVGTMAYLSPEQVEARPADARSDIYALGTVLYECVVGEPPFGGEVQSILYRIVHDLPQPPRALGADIEEDLEATILACLAKDPARRPQHAGEVAEALKKYRSRLRETDRTRSLVGTRTFHIRRPAPSAFVGRAKEFAELQQRLNAAAAGECQFVLVAGEPGIGKTRLLDELEALCRARKVRVLHGRSVEQERSFPYQGFCEIIQDYFRLKDSAGAPRPDLQDIAADLVSLFPVLGEISEIRAAATSDSTLTRPAETGAAENRTQIFELLARTLTRIAGGQPLVLLLEDLHGAAVSIEALQYIVRRLGPTPTLIVGTYRSTEVGDRHPLLAMLDSFRGDRRFATLTLGPFSPSEHRTLLETFVGGSPLTDTLVERLFDATKGNPFFAKELLRSLLDSGALARDRTGAWSLSAEAGLATEALPATIQQAVETRIRRLPEALQEVLSMAAIIGRTFDARDLEALAEGEGDLDVEDALDRLLVEGIVEEERESRGDVLVFASGVVRDVLYAGLARRKRRSLHRRYAQRIEARHAGRLERILPQLVHHFDQGDVPDKAVEYGLRHARASLEAFSAEEAARAAKTALGYLDKEWEGERVLEGEAHLVLGRAQRMAGDIEGALREAAAAIRVFERESQLARLLPALLLAAETAWEGRRTEEAGRWVEKGLAAARSARDTEALRTMLTLAATLASLRGEYDRANAHLEEAGRLGVRAKEAEAQEEVPAGGRLVVAFANPAHALDPAAIPTIEDIELAGSMFDPLLATDAQGNLVPCLCEKWEASEGGRAFLFTLRRNVRFSDGSPLTARDVKASFEGGIRQVGSGEGPAAYAAIQGVAEYVAGAATEVAGLVVRGDESLEMRLREPLPIYPALLTDVSTGIARRRAGDGKTEVLGTGPFRLASQSPERIVVERNPEHWRGAPRLEAIEFRTSLNATAMARAFRSGEIDLARDLLPQDLEEILRDGRFRRSLVEIPKKSTYFVLFNSLASPIMARPEVRQALSGFVRTPDLVWRTLGRFAQPAAGLIPPAMLGHDPGRRLRLLGRDEATALLRAAGGPSPLRLRAAVHPLLLDRYRSLLDDLRAVWSELAVEVEVATPDMSSYLECWPHNEKIDLLIGRWDADYDDPDNFTHALLHSGTGLLSRYFSSPESDQLLDEARAEARPAVREALYRRYEKLLLDAWALLPLFHDIDYRLASPRVRGLVLRGSPPYVNYSELGKTETVEPVAEAALTGGSAFHVPLPGVVATIDPALASTFEQTEVLLNVFETLTRDVGGARIVPWLASDFQAEEGGRRYRFRLRDEVRFHDGRRLTARDVRYSFERLLQAKGSDARWMFTAIRGARTLLDGEGGDLAGLRIHSANEFTIELEEPVSFFPALLAFHAASIVPEGSDPSGREGVGTGPYRLLAFEPGRQVELTANRGYWRKGYPRNSGLIFAFGVPPPEILAGFREGRFALASHLLPADVESLRREPGFAAGYRESPRLVTYYAAFNAHRGPLADPRLRRRVARAADVPRIVQKTLGRLAVPASGFIPPGLAGHDPAARPRLDTPLPGEGEPAEPIELTVAANPIFFAGHAAFARELQAALAEKGIRVRIVNKTMAEFEEAETQATVDVSLSRWIADYPDADTFVHPLHRREGFLGRLCGSAELDPLIERGRAEPTPAMRHSLYRQIEEILAREALLVPLYHEQEYRFARPEIQGLSVFLWGRTVAYEELRLRE